MSRPLAAILAAALTAAPAAAQDDAAPAEVPVAAAPDAPADAPADAIRGDEVTPAQQAAVEKGLTFLASRQEKDGSFGRGGFNADTGITSLAAIAMMSAGNLPGRGAYGANVQRAVDYIVSEAQESGLLAGDGGTAVMYSHGFATLFLAEVYGMTGDEQVKEKLQRAVRLIGRSQNAEGGWRYQPAPVDADISVTICQIMGLRAARDAGIKVEKAVIDRAVEYVRGCQNGDGGFSYMSNRGGGGGGSAFPRSAAGVASLFYAGIYDGPEVERGMAYLASFRPGGDRARGGENDAHYFYGHYYAVQTMFLAGGTHWAEWYPAVRDELVRRQKPDGSWDGQVSNEYATAMALIILQMPNRYLPVFSGKGPGS